MCVLNLFEKLGSYPAHTGNENIFIEKTSELLNSFCSNVKVDNNNIIACSSTIEVNSDTLAVFVDCSTDAYMVTGFYDGGFVEVRPFGKSTKLYACGQHFTIYGKENVIGVSDFIKYTASIHDANLLTIQTGRKDEELRSLISLGDYADIQNPVTSMLNGNIKGGWCAHRAPIVAAIMMLKTAIKNKQNVALCITTGPFGAGAKYIAEKYNFKKAVVLETIESIHSRQNEKPYIVRSFATYRSVTQELINTARANKLPFNMHVIYEDNNTMLEKTVAQVSYSQGGCDVALVGVPARRANTSTQTVNINTVKATHNLLCCLIGGNHD